MGPPAVVMRQPASPLPSISSFDFGDGAASRGSEEKDKSISGSSRMKAAADLIQNLDNAYSEMTSSAADAARDAETARRNARAASEIARRYMHRSYPKVQTPFGSGPNTPQLSKVESKLDGIDDNDPLKEISGIASALQTPREEQKYNFEPTPHQSRRNFNTPMSSERIAQSHAEDILALTADLERARQALKTEQRLHEETKALLASYKSKHASLEEQNQKLLEEMEQTKLEAQNETNEMEQELQKANMRVQAAEEDAQMALDLAKDSAEKNEQLEEWLQRATEEIRLLKEEKEKQNSNTPASPKRSVRFADTTPPPTPPLSEPPLNGTPSSISRIAPPREMVAVGRNLLRRSLHSPEEEVIAMELTPAKSAERRRRLRERLSRDVDIPTPQKSPQRPDSRVNTRLLEECKNSAKLLQQSGQRLDLGGHWWREQREQHEINLEAMTRQYCQSVEFSIERQRKEIDELESLCGFLENKLVMGS